MCGFAGIYSKKEALGGKYKQVLDNVANTILHRGPDDSGIWLDDSTKIGLVHRRLSIQDLSPLGAQPMASKSGRYIIVFNGEIYNFKELRNKLQVKGVKFTGHSDTETMLASFEDCGIEESLQKFSGMFAFAVFDRETLELTLARDRMGEKPLYYGWVNGYLIFASELKALRAFPFWQGDIDRDALTLLLRHSFIPAPHSIYKGIKKLPPATRICINLKNIQPGQTPEPEYYWSLNSYFDQGEGHLMSMSKATDKLDTLLHEVISEQMISDVPLGAFLSGGIDSSVVVAIMQGVSSSPIKSFSIGFEEKKYNEAEYAKAVAKHLGTEHTELYITARDSLNIVPLLPEIYDEPFADSSQIPTFLVAEMTKKHVTVALSGDGGDELFCGYSRYFTSKKSWENNNTSRTKLANQLFLMAAKKSPLWLAKLIKLFASSQRHLSVAEIAQKITRKQKLLSTTEFNEFYRQTISYWSQPELLVKGAVEPIYSMRKQPPENVGSDVLKKMMWQDINCYLPDGILVKVDRAAMACSLETRVPLLDRRIVEFSLGLPIAMNCSSQQGKQVLRNVLYRYVPRRLIEREKSGFGAPIDQWLRGELKEWASQLLDHSRLTSEGIWNPEQITRKWNDHIAGRGDHAFGLWTVLMFQAWYEKQHNV